MRLYILFVVILFFFFMYVFVRFYIRQQQRVSSCFYAALNTRYFRRLGFLLFSLVPSIHHRTFRIAIRTCTCKDHLLPFRIPTRCIIIPLKVQSQVRKPSVSMFLSDVLLALLSSTTEQCDATTTYGQLSVTVPLGARSAHDRSTTTASTTTRTSTSVYEYVSRRTAEGRRN